MGRVVKILYCRRRKQGEGRGIGEVLCCAQFKQVKFKRMLNRKQTGITSGDKESSPTYWTTLLW